MHESNDYKCINPMYWIIIGSLVELASSVSNLLINI